MKENDKTKKYHCWKSSKIQSTHRRKRQTRYILSFINGRETEGAIMNRQSRDTGRETEGAIMNRQSRDTGRETEGAIMNRQSRDTGTFRHTRHMTKNKAKPKTQHNTEN